MKKINVSAGSDIADVMVSDGALMVLSLDGKMAVSLADVSGVSAGDTVTVVLSSGTEVSGTVDSVSGDDCVVTVTDDGTTYGDMVAVTDSSGNELGSGELTIHQPLEITGTSGTVSVVNVSENTSVSEDTTILTLEGNANETEYQELLAKREARTVTLKKLIQLKTDPEIRAEIAGTAQSVNASAGSGTSDSGSTGSNTGSTASGSTSTSGGKTVSQMSYTTVEDIFASDSSSAESTEATVFSTSEYSTDVALFTISPDDTMTLNVSVDELDINSVEIGQEAAITFDAIEDKEFTGEVTEIGNTASVSGGVAKYTVSISVPKDEQMKQGMNASATVTIENRENVITIPVNALQEKGDRVFVYTSTDEEGNLSGETEVKTGTFGWNNG